MPRRLTAPRPTVRFSLPSSNRAGWDLVVPSGLFNYGVGMQRAVLMDQREIVIEEVSIPQIGPSEVLIKNKVSTTRGTDVKIYMRGYPLLKPSHPFGHGFSGVIAAVGEASWGLRRAIASLYTTRRHAGRVIGASTGSFPCAMTFRSIAAATPSTFAFLRASSRRTCSSCRTR